MTVARTLLDGVIDYAGMFPRAALPPHEAVAAYRRHRQDSRGWLLGPLVVAATTLEQIPDFDGDVSVIVGLDVERQLALALAHAERVGYRASVTIECGPQAPAIIETLARRIPPGVTAFFETPVDDQMNARLDAIQHAGARAKIRTGGVAAAAFPSAEQVYRFFLGCAQRGLRCKATAGLHHALTGTYPLTYDRASERSRMFGFLNVCAAAALARKRAPARDGVAALEERAPEAIVFTPDEWRCLDHRWTVAEVASLRADLFRSFGSCSFDEPARELEGLGVL